MKTFYSLFLTLLFTGLQAQVPTAEFTYQNPSCSGQPILFIDESSSSGPPITSWSWQFPGGNPTSSNYMLPSITYNNSGTYTITLIATNSSGNSAPVTHTISIIPSPTVTVNSSTICSGNSAVLNASGASNYNWSPSTGLSSTSGNSVSASPTVTISYTVIGSDVNSCQASATTTVTVVSCAGIADTPNNSKFSIYPNPTSDQLFIEANTNDKLTVDMYDINGRHVFSANISDKLNINVINLVEGIYSMTIKGTNDVITKKVIILR